MKLFLVADIRISTAKNFKYHFISSCSNLITLGIVVYHSFLIIAILAIFGLLEPLGDKVT